MQRSRAQEIDRSADLRALALLLLTAAAGIALRSINLGDWPLWSDEALTLLIAQWPVTTLFLQPVDPTPGLYYALHHVILGPMVDSAGARWISLVAGALLIPTVYCVARTANLPPLLAAALVALSFPLIDYSQEARAYSLLVLMVTVSAGLFIGWAKTGRWPLLFASLTFGALSSYTHFAAAFWVGPLALAMAWLARREAVTPLLLLALVLIPEVARILRYDSGAFSWLLQATPLQAADTLAEAVLPLRLSGAWALLTTLLVAWRAWAHWPELGRWARANRGAAATLLIILSIPLQAWLFGFVAKPVFMTRTILIAVPGFMLALALLLSFEHRLVRIAVLGLYAATLVTNGTTRQKEDWREIASRVGGDPVLMCQPGQVAALRHALREDRPIFLRNPWGLMAISGSPWQTAYFRVLSDPAARREAERRGKLADPVLFPVWAVRSGSLSDLAPAPTTLAQAVRICDSHASDRAPRYIAE